MNPAISDLFFNTQHTSQNGEYPDLHREAEEFVGSLEQLGLAESVTAEELVQDFEDRL